MANFPRTVFVLIGIFALVSCGGEFIKSTALMPSLSSCPGVAIGQSILQQQGEEFPRSFEIGQDSSKFPQEVNDSDHQTIYIRFSDSQNLFTIPLIFTIDTVANKTFGVRVTLDDGDLCWIDQEPRETYIFPEGEEVGEIGL